MTSTQGAPPRGDGVLPQDGRLARSVRTRRAIVDALRSLHAEGELRPTAPRVAERAGVSLRTVWQHFADLEALFVEAGRRDYEIAAGYVRTIDPGAPLAARVRALVNQRARMFDDLAPTWRAARLQEPFSAAIQANRDRLQQLGRGQLEAVFAPELARRPPAARRTLLDALHVAAGWATWEALRTDLHLDRAAAQRAVLALVGGLFDDDRPMKGAGETA